MIKKTTNYILIVISILILATGIKSFLLIRGVVPFNSDEAIVGLMARHILMGELPLLFYGQAYMGSLDAFLVALFFLMFGQKVLLIRIVQIILYLLVIITTMLIIETAHSSRKMAIVAGLLLAFPTVNMTLYTTASLGGYGEALLFGNLTLLSGIWIWRLLEINSNSFLDGYPKILPLTIFWGFIAGVGFWTNAITGVYSIPIALILGYRIIKVVKSIKIILIVFVSATLGFLTGSLPWWIYAIQNGWTTSLKELFGGAIQNTSMTSFQAIFDHLINLVLLGIPVIFGFRPPWEIWWLLLPILPFALFGWGYIFYLWAKKISKTNHLAYLDLSIIGIFSTSVIGLIFTPFGNDPSGRYFLPITIIFTFIAVDAIVNMTRRKLIQFIIPGLLIIYQLGGIIQSSNRYPPGITTQFFSVSVIDHRYDDELIRFLKNEGEYNGYTNYWVSYPLAFLSEETLIFIPSLPYHLDLNYTPRDNRYQPYVERVQNANRVAYILTNNPPLEDKMRKGLQYLNITWKEETIGDYLIFYKLSKIVRPAEIGL